MVAKTGSPRKLSSGRWQARVSTKQGTRESLGTYPTRAEAQTAINDYYTGEHYGIYANPNRGRIPFDLYATEWLTTKHNLRRGTLYNYESRIRNHLIPFFGVTPLNEISPLQVRRFLAQLDVQPNAVYGVLRTIMNEAVRDGIIPRSPCTPERTHKPRTVTIVDIPTVYKLANTIDPYYRPAVLLAAFGSCRAGEALGLNIEDIARDGTVTINKQVTCYGGKRIVAPTKSDAGIRDIKLPTQVTVDILEYIKWHPAAPDKPLIRGKLGAPVYLQTLNRKFREARERLIAQGLELEPDFRFHDLRHTGHTITAAIPGITFADLKYRLGDSTDRMVTYYMHASEQAIGLAGDGLTTVINEAMNEQLDG